MDKKLYLAISRFYHHIALTDLRHMNSALPTANVTYNSLLYLDIIHSHQGQFTASALAELLHISKPAVISKVNELMKQGLVYKKQSQTDKRAFFLFVHDTVIPQFTLYQKQDLQVATAMNTRYTKEQIAKFCEMLEFMGDQYIQEGTENE